MFTELPECPDWELDTIIGPGHWTQGVAEGFLDPDTKSVTHLHFYASKEDARKLWPRIKHLAPKTIKTVSFRQPERPWQLFSLNGTPTLLDRNITPDVTDIPPVKGLPCFATWNEGRDYLEVYAPQYRQ